MSGYRYFFSFFLLAAPGLQAKIIENQVLAKVSSSTITDRQVLIDYYLENPAAFAAEGRKNLDAKLQGEYLQRVIVQKMVFEESRIFAQEKVKKDAVQAEVLSLKKRMGDRYKIFMVDFDLSELELQDIFRQKILLELSLEDKVQTARTQLEGKKDRDREAEKLSEKLIEDWLKQLRSRYKVQIFEFDRGQGGT